MSLKELLEVSSDLLAGAGGLLVIVPVFMITKNQAVLHRKIEQAKVSLGDKFDPEKSPARELREQIARIADFRAYDWHFMKFGGFLLALGFVLRIWYWCLAKN